jgi:L-ascorbate metabolism protein UlaG (beta-lactamase superfamily)
MTSTNDDVAVRLIGGPTALIEIGGLRLLTDPTFDPPGDHPIGDRALVKTRGPAVSADRIGPVDAVLLSHDQHPDNLDDAGRRYLDDVPLVLTTAGGAERLGGTATALPLWRHVTLSRPDGRTLRVTGVPAKHGPDGTEDVAGEVIGFVLSGEGLPAVYVSGDNASLGVVREVADHLGPIGIALLFAGAARTPLLDAYLTIRSDQAAEAATILGAHAVVPLHTEGWGHFTEGPETVLDAFTRRGLRKSLVLLAPGERAAF